MAQNKKLIKEVIISGTPIQRLRFRQHLYGLATDFGDSCVPGVSDALRDFDEERYDGERLVFYLNRFPDSFDSFLNFFSN